MPLKKRFYAEDPAAAEAKRLRGDEAAAADAPCVAAPPVAPPAVAPVAPPAAAPAPPLPPVKAPGA